MLVEIFKNSSIIQEKKSQNMLDDECDELPLVSVGIANYNLINFCMPPADVLALQRAREQECEHELRILRQSHVSHNIKCTSVGSHSTPSNSSEMEGESGLVEAVDVLSMKSHSIHLPVSVDLANLIIQFIKYLPEGESQFLQDYLQILQNKSPAITKVVDKEMVEGIEGGVQGQSAWLLHSIVSCSAWLCALCVDGVANGSEPRLRHRRALHAVLQHASGDQLEELAGILCLCLRAPRLLLELSDVLQGCQGPARRLAARLVNCALEQCEGECAGEWRSLTHVQLAGRCAAAGGAPPHHVMPRSREHSDTLKVAVAACRLQHLCHHTADNATTVNSSCASLE